MSLVGQSPEGSGFFVNSVSLVVSPLLSSGFVFVGGLCANRFLFSVELVMEERRRREGLGVRSKEGACVRWNVSRGRSELVRRGTR